MVATARYPIRRVVTGARGAGKTTFCLRVAEIAHESGWQVAGLLSLSRFAASGRTGILAQDLRSGEQRLLASLQPGEIDGVRQGRWSFSAAALKWADESLARAVPCDLLIIDEIGPLELEHNKGLTSWRLALCGGSYRVALAVVRPELETQLRRDWQGSTSIVITSPCQARKLAADLIREGILRE